MTGDFEIKGFADTSYKIGGSVFCLILFAIGYWAFRVLDHGRFDLFWGIWLGFTGGVAFLTLISRSSRITHQALFFTYFFLGALPLFRRTILPRSDFHSVERRCLKAFGYDGGSEGIYRHQIVLLSKTGKEWVLQEFHDRQEQNPPEVLSASTKIANRLQLPLSHHVESW